MYYSKHEDVDVRFPELPVRPVNGQLQRSPCGEQFVDEACHEVGIKGVFGIKTLDSPQTWVRLGFGVKTDRQFTETYRSCLAQSHYEERYELDVGKIDFFAEEMGKRVWKLIIFAFVIDIHSEIFVVKNFC